MTRARLKGIFAGPIDLDPRQARVEHPKRPAEPGVTVTHRATGTTGTVIAVDGGSVTLRLPTGGTVRHALRPGAFSVDGRTVTLVRPAAPRRQPGLTASGSIATPTKAQVARASRIWVEGKHDAELLEKIWGDDLRSCAIVVEPMGGMDDLAGEVRSFAPAPTRRLGILLDHLVEGSKESREAARVVDDNVLITGHPFVDVWAAVKPQVAGIDRWPDVPMGTPWKHGICAALGVGHPADFWRQLLGRVTTWTDLDTSLINAVERLLDFVTLDEP